MYIKQSDGYEAEKAKEKSCATRSRIGATALRSLPAGGYKDPETGMANTAPHILIEYIFDDDE